MNDELKKVPTEQLVDELISRNEVKITQERLPEDTYAVCYKMGIDMKIPKGSLFLCITPAKQHD